MERTAYYCPTWWCIFGAEPQEASPLHEYKVWVDDKKWASRAGHFRICKKCSGHRAARRRLTSAVERRMGIAMTLFRAGDFEDAADALAKAGGQKMTIDLVIEDGGTVNVWNPGMAPTSLMDLL